MLRYHLFTVFLISEKSPLFKKQIMEKIVSKLFHIFRIQKSNTQAFLTLKKQLCILFCLSEHLDKIIRGDQFKEKCYFHYSNRISIEKSSKKVSQG